MTTDGSSGAHTVSEFCQRFHIGKTFFYAELKAGKLTAVKAGTKTLVLVEEANRWARSLPKLKTGKPFEQHEPMHTGLEGVEGG